MLKVMRCVWICLDMLIGLDHLNKKKAYLVLPLILPDGRCVVGSPSYLSRLGARYRGLCQEQQDWETFQTR